MEQYVLKDNKKLRCGYTTGSCAAAAAQRATAMVLGTVFSPDEKIVLYTPKGVRLELAMVNPESGDGWASCAVKKDGGDDPDVTNGILIYVRVSKIPKEANASAEPQIILDGGIGVGRVTKRGLACSVGEAAINPVPREMILEQVRTVCEEFDYVGDLRVELSVPEGEEIAKRTFNAQLGVLGGISILGTSGIVEPMSEQALIDTIKVKMNVRKADGAEYLVITPGNYGETFLKSHITIPDIDSVKCSNFVGEALDYAELSKFKGVLLVGHIGKFIKVAAGVMNTHSKYGDARMEIMGAHAALAGAQKEVVETLLTCVTTEDAISVLDQAGIREQTLQSILERLDLRIKERVHHSLEIGAIIFSNQYGYLGETADAPLLRRRLQSMEPKDTNKKIGKLYGLGVGPGDPELMTLKAARLIKQCHAIAIPASGRETNVAYEIARGAVPEIETKELLEISMPMIRDESMLKESHDKAAAMVVAELEKGKDIAFLTLGDPSIYSTYIYIHNRVTAQGHETEIVPGIPSFCAVAARLNEGLTEASEALHVIPASYEGIEEALALKGTRVLMKSGRSIGKVKAILEQMENPPTVKMVERCGMQGERVFNRLEDLDEEASYFSILVLKD